MIATVSFYAFERPLNNLKRFFPYTPAIRSAPLPEPHSLPIPSALADTNELETVKA